MEKEEMEALIKVITRIERKLDTVIRAIYEHDEDIQHEHGRSQRAIETGRREASKGEGGNILECDDESSLSECAVPGVPDIPKEPITKRSPIGEANPIKCKVSDVQGEGESGATISKRSPIGEANPIRGNGEVQRQESIPRSDGKNKNVPRENGVQQHASSKPNASRQHHSRGGRQRGSNDASQGSNR